MIPIVYDLYEDEEYLYIIMEYIEGITLYDYKHMQSIILDEQLISITLQICVLVEYLQSREDAIVYFDLKPSNLMIYGNKIKLVDFGSAYLIKDKVPIQDIKLTKKYAAPEQIEGGVMNERTYIYSIGKILEFLLEDNIEYSSRFNLKKDSFLAIQRKCCAKYSIYRYSSIEQLKKEITKLVHKQKRKGQQQLPKQIGIIGACHRIGVTHLSLFLTAYFNSRGVSCIYIECNQSKHMYSIYKYNPNYILKNHLIYYKNIHLIHIENIEAIDLDIYDVVIYDFGHWSEKYTQKYESMDMIIGILGSKPWEMDHAIELMKKGSIFLKKIIYLCNYSSSYDFNNLQKESRESSLFRIPFFNDPISSVKSELVKKFGEEISTVLSDYHRTEK